MQRAILIAIIVVILIAIGLGIYFFMSNSGQIPGSMNQQNNGNNNATNFQIQGMKVEVLRQGSGVAAKSGDTVTVNYVGTLANGTKFDSSIDRNAPFTFALGQQKVIKGWDLGVDGMKVGEKRKLTIPPELAYGSSSFLMIPANATLTFEVELLKIN